MDTEILSTLQAPGVQPARQPAREPAVLVFDACQLGVVLATVLFVELVVGVGAMYGAGSFLDWLGRMALLTGGAVPAALAWLILACSLKRLLARLAPRGQYLLGVSLGALAGMAGCGLMTLAGVLRSQPWLACACTGALLAGLLVAALMMRARGRTPAATAARLLELQARIRPHFLFNTLNSAIALVRAEPRKAEAVLEDLSELFRSALVDQGEAVTLTQELELARRYLDIEQVRFGERLRVQWSVDPNAGNAKLPPLLLQPLVENAVLHGVEPSAEGAEVRISTLRRGSIVIIKVTNTVPAGTGKAGSGLAMANVRDRLSLLHDVQAQFRTILKDGVFQVRMEVPA